MTLQIHSECQDQYIAPKTKSLTSSAVQKQFPKGKINLLKGFPTYPNPLEN